MLKRRLWLCAIVALFVTAPAFPAAPAGKAARKRGAKKLVERQYKKFGRALMTKLARGELDQVVRDAEKILTEVPGDVEALYFLALARAGAGQIDQAVEAAGRAVQGGLPIGRFLAGPRNLARPLVESKGFAALLAKHPTAIVHGPMLGSVTHERARVWVRTAGEADVRVECRPAGKPEAAPLRSEAVRSRADADYTAVAEVAGLKPATAYRYRVLVDGRAAGADPAGTFRTFPAPGTKARFQVVFGGGAGYTPPHEHMWLTILGRKPTAFLAMGDNVYIDTPQVPETQRYCYYRRQSRPEWRRFVANTPVFAIWDDHDFGTNDCQGSPGIDDIPWKLPVWRVFRENWANPSYGGGEKCPGVWFDFSIGDVDFIMLDCRFYRLLGRGGRQDDSGTMLGPAQKKWLLSRLKESRGTFKVLASSVPWSKGTKGGSRDTWDGFGREREEIFSFLADNHIEGVFLISADRHRSDAYKTDRPGAYPLYEASSSKLTNVHTHGLIPHALFGYNEKCSFGLLTFDTTAADPTLTYQVINIDNEVVHTLTVKRSELSFPR